ncbi:MAG TPA: 2-hydroxyglutaryl-CoA dehydratase [Polyangiaceae bacterium]|nr:2-hydroxyglutaryl-CoA dehydratase [Polyangiaceae bacterium]
MTPISSLDSVDKKRSLPVIGSTLDIDAELRAFEAAERARLGLEETEHWVEEMANLTFTKSERANITMLIGGLTVAHDYIVSGGLKNAGYEVVALDAPDYESLRVGKEFGNRAQCNPTYFTVGNLVKVLIHLRDKKGLSTEEIIQKYVFLTAGACGPCRFGMYTTEYRKALRDAGFDGFRVMLFQQQGGLSQATGEASGLEMNPKFFINMLKGLVAGDIINGLGYRIRPYEVVPGATDEAIEQAKRICYDALLNGNSILFALMKVKRLFAEIAVDRLTPKPKVAIIGEFWAMTTEGDGNYRLQRFVEHEGAEADIQFVTAWLLYNIWEVAYDTSERKTLRYDDVAKNGLAGIGEYGALTRKLSLWAGDKALRAAFHTFAYAGGYYDYHLPDMHAIAEVAAPYYDNNLRGGEGHMEVGKLILNVVHNKASMTLSVKPFGCMPSSSVSDGVQSLITEKFPGTIYCAVETSGDGAVNFQSRVQMYMFKARKVAEAEFENTLAKWGLTIEQVRAFVDANPRFKNALHRAPLRHGSIPADLVEEIAPYITQTPLERATTSLRGAAGALVEWAKGAALGAPTNAQKTMALGRELAVELAEIAREKGPGFVETAVQKGVEQAQKGVEAARAKVVALPSRLFEKAS